MTDQQIASIFVAIAAGASFFGAAVIALGLLFRSAAGPASARSRSFFVFLVLAMIAALATILAALGAFPFAVAVVLGAGSLSGSLVAWGEARRAGDRVERVLLLTAAAFSLAGIGCAAWLTLASR